MDLDSLYRDWTPLTESAWGKLDNDNGPDGDTLSVVAHLADAAHVANWLWDHFLAERIKRQLAQMLGGPEAARAAVVFSAGHHDVGKVSRAFAVKADVVGFPTARARMQRAGFDFMPEIGPTSNHAVISHVALERWLQERHRFRRRVATSLACIAGGHHGTFPGESDVSNARRSLTTGDALGSGVWHVARTEVLDRVAAATDFSEHVALWKRRGWPVPAQMLINGIVILADWLASDSSLFPYGDARPGRLEAAIERIDLPRTWRAEAPSSPHTLFSARFPQLKSLAPSALQQAIVEAALETDQAALMIIEAPMGSGKTEAAFMGAESLAATLGCGGVFIGLPTMATSNPMFNRTLDWLNNTLSEDASVMLAHSKSGLHDGFSGLVEDTRLREIYDERNDAEPSVHHPHTVVASWLMGRKKATQASFVVGTVDQLLMMALRAKHVSLRQLAMAGKVVIVDECHAADDYMRVYLKRALTWLGRLGAPVILMSATLPPTRRQEFADAYRDGLGALPSSLPSSNAYPRISVVGELQQVIAVEPDSRRTTIDVTPIDDDLEVLTSTLRQTLDSGGCVAVIRNTVRRAQEAYEALTAEFGDSDVVLLHSRFVAPHRAVRERELVERLGRSGDRPHRLVVVGTQVLEQSLDIDVDLMVSDLAPMDLLLQRAGRLHRHIRANRPDAVRLPRLLVTGVDRSDIVPTFAQGCGAVYGDAKLLRSAALIGDGLSVHLPADIPVLVDKAYDPAFQKPAGWDDAWEQAELEERQRIAAQVDMAGKFLLTKADEESTLVGCCDATALDPESPKGRGKRQVRDAEESIEVIVLQKDADGDLRFLPGTGPSEVVIPTIPHADIPFDVARQMAAATVSLPWQMVTGSRFDAVESALNRTLDYDNWERSPWLRGQLALVLDQHGHASVAGFDLEYSNRKGLMYSTESTEP